VGEPAVVALSVSNAPFWFWWLVPVAATVLVLLVVGFARRERRPRDGADAIDDYTRFREAMAQVRRQEQDPP